MFKNLFQKYHPDIFFMLLLAFILYKQFSNIKFIFESNLIIFSLIQIPLIIFIWIGIRSKIDKGHFLSMASIILAVSIYLLSVADNNASKIKLLIDMNNYNCLVSRDILSLNGKIDLSQNFTLRYFISQPYFDNANFLLQKFGTTTGTLLISSAYDAQGANTLINQVQNLNIQGSNPLFGQFIKKPLEMYNSQLLEIASNTGDIFCKNLW